MHRNFILGKLENYKKTYPEETELVEAFEAFINKHKDCFERSLEVGHIVASAWLVNKKGSQVLLTHHKKLNRWLQLGGHSDGDPNSINVALREAREESGIEDITLVSEDIFDIDLHLIPRREEEKEHLHYDIRFIFKVVGGEEFKVSHESHDLRWLDIDKLDQLTKEESVLRMRRKYLLSLTKLAL